MTTSAMTPSFENMVAVVTGASRGAGRGIAAVLGERGATVYVTGRSVRGRPCAPSRSGSIEETAKELIRRGGTAVAVRCDHTIDAEIAELFERVRREQGRLDLLGLRQCSSSFIGRYVIRNQDWGSTMDRVPT